MEVMISTPVSELNMRRRHGTLKDTGFLEEKQTCLRPAFLSCVTQGKWFYFSGPEWPQMYY